MSFSDPDATMHVEGSTYTTPHQTISVTNLVGPIAHFGIFLHSTSIQDEAAIHSPMGKPFSGQMLAFIQGPKDPPWEIPANATFTGYCDRLFLVSVDAINFTDAWLRASLEIGFVRVIVGTYRCFILFADDNSNEFISESSSSARRRYLKPSES
jgi:hypothetical protein